MQFIMKKTGILLALFLFVTISLRAQVSTFPQQAINTQLKKADFSKKNAVKPAPAVAKNTEAAFQCIAQMDRAKNTNWDKFISGDINSRALDTVYVGALITDTMVITGTYNHEGPIFVFNQGVLIIHNATFTNEGDIYVFGDGQILCDSSTLNFPQQYFYQRGLIAVQHGMAYFKDVSFNYSGMQHNLVVGDSATVAMENVHQNDWTTAGLFGEGAIFVDGMNLGGEYILTDSSTSVFKHVDTLLLWHKFPQPAVINHTFPQGNTVYNYYFSNVLPGISGVNYENFTDSCNTVWWGIMPVNGSDVTIQNSNIRVAGAWFQFGDSISVSGVQNGTFYPNTLIPLADRTLNMLNTFVQTWSFYVFDSSYVAIDNCTLGEVGTQQTSTVTAQDMLLDGSGGYFWATDTSFTAAVNVTSYATTRSEKNGIFLLAYSEMPFSAPTATVNSLIISVQNNTAADPYPYDNAIAWNQKIESPAVAHADSLIPITGSAWINQGPIGGWMDFLSYSIYYQIQGAVNWTPIVLDSLQEISHNTLAIWNTNGLQAGDYILRQMVRNNLGDSVESFVNVQLLANTVTQLNDTKMADEIKVAPNPAAIVTTLYFELTQDETVQLNITDISGKNIAATTQNYYLSKGKNKLNVDVTQLSNGMYFIALDGKNQHTKSKLIVNHH